MTTTCHTLIDTPIGWIGLAWRDQAVVRLALPGSDRAATERGLLRGGLDSVEVAPLPEPIARIAKMVRSYVAGEPVDFSAVPILLDGVDPLRRAIYAALRKVGYGETLTYGELADRAGFPGQAREIGQAMGRNPVPMIVPCHRVLAAGGKPGGFSAPGGVTTKQKMLALEGVRLGPPESPQGAFAF